jgi:hypothetical protein
VARAAEVTVRRGPARAAWCGKGDDEARACAGGGGDNEATVEARGGTWEVGGGAVGQPDGVLCAPRVLKRSSPGRWNRPGKRLSLYTPPFVPARG